ncbi:MAG: aromatic ring-hydroxylating dioxygenase subunit alpha [Proteobacteria bacterium]|nr:aromatic ring-hydroxylating dioxygenase subunit alpha [Pseudomonadota bacterium]
MHSKMIAGEPILFIRTKENKVSALRDICPHRGIPLSCGLLLNTGEVECCYHGWRFNSKGQCTRIPSLTKDQDFDLSRIHVRTYPCIEKAGTIWIFIGDEKEASLSPFPYLPETLPKIPSIKLKMIFPCSVDHAVVGLMDPAHGPFVHQSWFWRNKNALYEKQKSFEPIPLGFKMSRHAPSKNGRAYKILGPSPQTEISFMLPGVRVETITTGKKTIWGITTITPVTETSSEIHHLMYWKFRGLSFFKPLIYFFASIFLKQDQRAIILQQKGLAFNPPLLLINDADTQAKWYYKLKKEYKEATLQKIPFVNPLKSCILKWMS